MSHSVHATRDEDTSLIEVGGDVDSAAAEDFTGALTTATEGPERPKLVIVDLENANFLDSRTMGLLAEWQTRIKAWGGRLTIAGARPEVVRLFTMIGLEGAFEFAASVDDARRHTA